jgi:hypothetical protein
MAQTKTKMQILIDIMERVIDEFKIDFGIDSIITNQQYHYQRFYYHGIEIGCYFRDAITIAKKIVFYDGRIWDSNSVNHRPKNNYEGFKNEVYSSIKKILPNAIEVEKDLKEWKEKRMMESIKDDFV